MKQLWDLAHPDSRIN